MADHNIQTVPEGSMTGLVTGIMNDAQDLVKQQFALLKHEVKEDLHKTLQAAIALGIGVAVALVGALSLWLALVYLLAWAFPVVPDWGWFAIVGVLFLVAGALIFYAGKAKLESFNPLPDESAQALKENVQWITRPK
jgi:uncharacterized membrane protein YqjE